MDLAASDSVTRRRGDALEDAILEAAWEQLVASGYAGFTYDAIARRAQTSKPVLYRRWATREDLLTAVLGWRGASDRLPVPDTGSLRGDVLELLRSANKRPERFLALLSAHVGGLYSDAGLTPAILRERYIASGPNSMETIVSRAVERSEITRPSVRVIAVPFELFRQQLFMTLEALPDDELVAIVDEVFLPLAAR